MIRRLGQQNAFTFFARRHFRPQGNGLASAAEHLAGVASNQVESRGECTDSRNSAGQTLSASDLFAAAKAKAALNRQMARDAAALGSTRAWPFH
jgi:hypothetical protein